MKISCKTEPMKILLTIFCVTGQKLELKCDSRAEARTIFWMLVCDCPYVRYCGAKITVVP
jgi:hypothetical protein